MKTPEEIKNALRICSNWEKNCEECPYKPMKRALSCSAKMKRDSIAYIEQLEKHTSLNDMREEETITRCKDCKRWGAGYPSETEKIKCCQIAGYLIGENGYCLYAEAKDEG